MENGKTIAYYLDFGVFPNRDTAMMYWDHDVEPNIKRVYEPMLLDDPHSDGTILRAKSRTDFG